MIEHLEQEAPPRDDDQEHRAAARKLIPMPRSRYVDEHGMPVDAVFAPSGSGRAKCRRTSIIIRDTSTDYGAGGNEKLDRLSPNAD